MSVVIAIKVEDGFALAADSATTVVRGSDVENIYDNANKIINLHKSLPIGLATWDAGSIGRSSIATVAKDLRRRMMGRDQTDPFYINQFNYSMEDVAKKVRAYFYEERYLRVHDISEETVHPSIGFYVCGFGSEDEEGREFEITIYPDGSCGDPTERLAPEGWNLGAYASPEPTYRLVTGISLGALQALVDRGMGEEEALELVTYLRSQVYTPLVTAPMPIKDSLDLAESLVRITAEYYRYSPGLNTVGGPIEVAAITKHEGFKWVKRKLYFPESLNP